MKYITTTTKTPFIFLLSFCILNASHAQLLNNGAAIIITSGATIYTEAALINTNNGTITNNGKIISNNDIINDEGSSLSGDGTYSIQRDFRSKGTFNQGSSTLIFFGSLNSILKNADGKIYILQVNKTTNYYVSLINDERVFKSVDFINDRNFVKLNDNSITLSGNCVVNNYSSKRYFVTNGDGLVKKSGVSAGGFTFPVGYDRLTYNPLTILENGTPDDYSVRCLQHAKLNGGSGDTISTGGINASWFVSEAVAGGANAVIQATWSKTEDELNGFDYTHCEVVKYTSGSWNYNNALAGTATQSSGYRSISRSGFTLFGYITVLSTANPTFAKNIFLVDNATSAKTAFKIYPTIVQNNINIDVPFKASSKMNITIINADGKAVWQKQNADFNSQKISIPDFAAGSYMVTINYDNKQFVQKIIINH